METFYDGHVTGLKHYQYEMHRSRIYPGVKLVVKPQPDNPYDSNAVGLYLTENFQIGWIPKGLNGPAAKALRDGKQLAAIVRRHDAKIPVWQSLIEVEVYEVQTAKPKEQTQMANTKVQNIIQTNLDMGTSAAFLEAGRIANKQLSAVAGKKLPIMVRAYADTPVGRLILGNLAVLAQEHFRPDDVKLQKLAKAMTVTAYQEVLQQFDVEQFIDDLLSNATIKKALKQVETTEA